MLAVLIRFVMAFAFLVLATGCTTNSPPPQNYYRSIYDAPVQQRCHVRFNSTDSTDSLCRWFHTGTFGASCRSDIRSELEGRKVNISPVADCGRPIQQVCQVSFNSSDSTNDLCTFLHAGSFGPACAQGITAELLRRNVQLWPRLDCGRQIAPPQCSLDISRLSSAEICTNYWGYRNVECDAAYAAELSKRGLQISKAACGQPVRATVTPTPNTSQTSQDQHLQTCRYSDLAALNKLSNIELCRSVREKGGCSGVARTILSGRGVSANSDSTCGERSADCAAHIDSFRAAKDPIGAGCDLRFARSPESVRCRINTVGFLFINFRRTGVNRSQCGAPLSPEDFLQFRNVPITSH
jgi:hypothetical protein